MFSRQANRERAESLLKNQANSGRALAKIIGKAYHKSITVPKPKESKGGDQEKIYHNSITIEGWPGEGNS